jgi:hypothetical protein
MHFNEEDKAKSKKVLNYQALGEIQIRNAACRSIYITALQVALYKIFCAHVSSSPTCVLQVFWYDFDL